MKRYPSIEKPWMQFFSEEAQQAELKHETIYQRIWDNNYNYPIHTALNFFGNKISYAQLFQNIDRAAGSLTALGVKAGDTVACFSVTIPEMVFTLYGANKIGATLFTLDPRRTGEEVEEMVRSSGAKIALVIDLAYDHLRETLENLDLQKIVIISVDNYMPTTVRMLKQMKMPAPKIEMTGNVVSWKQFLSYGKGIETEAVPYGTHEPAAITLTGGTTGMPKGVMITNDGFNAVAMDFRYCGVSYTREQRFMNIIPSFASYGIVASLHMPLSLGLEEVVIAKFDSDKVGHLIKKYKPSHTLLVPNHYEKLMNSKEMANGFDLSFFETAGSGGDTMNKGLENKLNGFLKDHGAKFPLSQGYGMSEISSAASCCCNGNFRSLSVGYPLLTNVISIFKPDTTEELTYGEEGEICMTGPAVMMGYLNNPEETANVLRVHPDGQVWIHSGDVGVMDEDGYIYIKGRIKRMITMFDGHKVFPTQLENTIGKHQGVISCAVVGVQDPSKNQGQMPVGIIKIKDGLDAEQVIQEVTETIQKEVEVRSWLSDLITVEDMPHTGMGKIDYKKLAEDYEKENQTAKAG